MLDTPSDKYVPAPVIRFPQRTWPSKQLTQAPRWCSTDLRDGNQSLANPMNIEKKLKFLIIWLRVASQKLKWHFPPPHKRISTLSAN